ncbi:MAG: hypothetical protein Q9222_005461 [Ikaeria aurantiellina]
MTIKAFLRKLATEREKAQKKQSVDTAATTPANTSAPAAGEHNASITPSTTSAQVGPASDEVPSTETGPSSAEKQSVPTEAQKDVPQPSIEVFYSIKTFSTDTDSLQATEDRVREESYQEQAQGENGHPNQTDMQEEGSKQPHNQQSMQMQGMNGQWPAGNGMAPGINGSGYGVNGMNSGFPNMAMGNFSDYNAMMQFMPNNAMGAFPNMMGMPGMPGMGMDPMQAMSQGMFGGFGGPGIGMNGMNGMNAAGMGFSTGQGWNDGGFNGQPAGSWMSGQDKYNQNAYGGHAHGMAGDFGANAAGYNGNYNQMNRQQFHHSNHDFQNGYHGQGFHSRGRGRGRGYPYAPRGRGGYNQQVMPGSHTNNEPFHHHQVPHIENPFPPPQQPFQSDNQANDGKVERNEQATDEQIAREMAPGDADESPYEPPNAVPPDADDSAVETDKPSNPPNDTAPTETMAKIEPKEEGQQKDQQQQEHAEKPAPIKTFISDEQQQDAEPNPSNSATTLNTMMPPPSPAVSLPSQQLPMVESPQEYNMSGRGRDRGLSRGSSDFRGAGRGRAPMSSLPNGNSLHQIPNSQSAQVPMAAPIEPKGLGVEGAPKGPKAMREGLPPASIRGGRGFSIVGRASVAAHSRINGHTRSQSRSRSRTRSRSRSPSRHRSHRRHSHRHRTPSASESTDHERRRERHKRRSRKYDDNDEADLEDSRDSSHRSSHRSSRRHRDEHRDDDDIKERERGHHSSHHHRHRSHRDDKDKIESHHRSSRKRSRTPDEIPHSSSSSRKRHSRHESDRERKRSRRDHDTISSNPQPAPPSSSLPANVPLAPKSHTQPPPVEKAIDPHELERQARNKERMMKEMQRREMMDERSGEGKKGGGRRVNYKFEDELEGLTGRDGRW